MLPYGRQSISDEDVSAIIEVLRGDWLTTGPAVAAFEEALSVAAGGLQAVACSSGTAALHTAYAATGVQVGDEVITSPMTFVATASTASMQGAKVVFADVTPDTANLDPDAVAAALTPRTKIVTAVDYAGHPCDYDELAAVAHEAEALLISDAAHSFGGTYKGRPVGTLADVTTLSFFPTKNLTTAEGGAVISAIPEVGRAAAEFRNIGLVRDPNRFEVAGQGAWHQEVHTFGLNYRLTDLACALGLSQLRRLHEFKRRRTEIVGRYNDALAGVDGIALPAQRAYVSPMWHLYPVRILDERRMRTFEHMRAEGIGVQVNYIPVYWHPVYQHAGYRVGMCPHAEKFYAEELSLPLYPDLSDDEVDRVIDTLIIALR